MASLIENAIETTGAQLADYAEVRRVRRVAGEHLCSGLEFVAFRATEQLGQGAKQGIYGLVRCRAFTGQPSKIGFYLPVIDHTACGVCGRTQVLTSDV